MLTRVSLPVISKVLLFLFCIASFIAAEVGTVSGIGKTVQEAEVNANKIALRNQIEQLITFEMYEKNRAKIEKVFIENYSSYTLSRKTLDSKNEFGVIKTRVRVEPNVSRLTNTLKEEGLMPLASGKPRIMILLDEQIQGEPSFEKSATYALEQVLTQKGFTVIEPEQMKKVKEQEKALGMNQNELATLAFRSGADLILKGKVSVGKGQQQTIYGISQFSVPIQMNVRVVRSDNAEIVLTRTKSTNKKAQSEFQAGQDGLIFGGKAVGGSVAKELTAIWRDELAAPKKIELMASGTSFKAIEDALAGNSAVLSSTMRYLEGNSALYDVQYLGTMQELRGVMDALEGWKVTLVTQNRLGVGPDNVAGEIAYSYKEPDISISNFSVKDILPSRGRFYETNSLASVTVDLKKGNAIENLTVSVKIPELMDLPSEKKVKSIASGSSATVDLALLLNNKKLLANKEERRLAAKAVVSFYQNGKKITRELSVPVLLHDANAMDWADASSIASFVTYRNSTVDKFARSAVIAADKTGFNDQFEEALAIFTALRKYGISYVKDPTPSGDARVLDKVQFPLETLEKKSGDCDDSSVLMAALLSAVGIDVAFISYPDHVLIMFDTGIYKKNRFKLGVDPKSVVIHNERCWIPVETTLLKKDFFEAWRTASAEYHQAVSDGQPIEITDLQSAWKSYPAFNYAKTNSAVTSPNVSKEIPLALDGVKKSLNDEIKTEIAGLVNKPNRSMKELNYLGILYARSGDYTKAVSHFTGISKGKDLPILANNLGCALLLTGDEKRGVAEIERSLSMKSTPPALVNRSLAYYLMSSSPEGVEKFVASMVDANNSLPKGVTLAQMLGIDLAEGTGDRAAGEHEAESAQTIDKRRLQELLKKRVLSRNLSSEAKEKGVTTNVNVMPFGGVRGADPTQVATIVDLLFWME